jgi:hypothetical protein
MPTGIEEITLFGGLITLGPVTIILIAEAVLFFLLMNIDRVFGYVFNRGGRSYTKFFLLWVFFMFALFSAAPVVWGMNASDLALILGTVVLFGAFIPGFGISNLKRNLIVLIVAILGSLTGYQAAVMILQR